MIDRYLNSVCGTPLWNPKAVYSEFPDFTFCFQYSLLIWVPCFLVWIGMPIWIYMLTKKKEHQIKISWLLVSKTLAILLLIFTESIHLYAAWYENDLLIYFMTPIILICTYVIVLLITHYERINGWRKSYLLFIFWLILLLNSTFTLRTKIYYHINKDNVLEAYGFEFSESDIKNYKLSDQEIKLFYFKYALILILFSLTLFNEKTTNDSNKKPSIISKIFHLWVTPLIKYAGKNDLRFEDLWKLDKNLTSEYMLRSIEKEWNKQAAGYKPTSDIEKANSKKKSSRKSKADGSEEEKLELNEMNNVKKVQSKEKKTKKPSLALCLIKIAKGQIFTCVLIWFIGSTCMDYIQPILLDCFINFVKDKEQKLSVGLFYVYILTIASLTQNILQNQAVNLHIFIGRRLVTALQNFIYNKSLKLSASARETTTLGEMTNLLAENAQVFHDILGLIHSSVIPLRIGVTIYYLYQKIGVGTFAGMAFIILIMPINYFLINKNRKISTLKEKLKDNRIKIVNEILTGIRVIRFYGWEISFKNIVKEVYGKEINKMWNLHLIGACLQFIGASTPYIVACLSFSVYLYVDEKNVLDASKIFVSLYLLRILKGDFEGIVHNVRRLVKMHISIKRITDFLLKDELNPNDITHIKKDNVISIKNINFGWNRETTTLKNINLQIPKNKLVAIVGSVGSGKSSILSAILGEMHKLNDGEINVYGSFAYVSQQAWIQNATVQDNILFNRTFDKRRYDEAVKKCCLQTDLDMMPAGDKTEIGEKGINLSGGQKQRISLTRSVYSDADIYLLDDPLSAVDPYVGKSIFDGVIGPKGILKHKTRVFVTNSMNVLPEVDEIIFIEDGLILEQGTYNHLLKNGKAFSNFIESFLARETEDIELTESTGQDKLERSIKSVLQRQDTVLGNSFDRQDSVFKKSFDRQNSVLRKSHSRQNSVHHKRSFSRQESVQKINFHRQTSILSSRIDHNSVLLEHQMSCDTTEAEYILSCNKSETEEIKAEENQPKPTATIIEEEKIETGGVNFKHFFNYLKACHLPLVFLFLICVVLGNVFSNLSQFWLSDWVNEKKTDSEANKYSKTFRLAIYLALGIIENSSTLFSALLSVSMAVKATTLFHDKLLFSVLRSKLRFFESTPIGRILNRFTKDCSATEGSIPDCTKHLCNCLMFCFANLVVILIITPWFIFPFIPMVLVYYFIQNYFSKANRQLKRIKSARRSPIFSHFSETQSGANIIKAFNKEKEFTNMMQSNIDNHNLCDIGHECTYRWLGLRLRLLGNLFSICTALFVVFTKSNLNAGLAAIVLSAALNLGGVLQAIVFVYVEFESNLISLERLEEYFNNEHEDEWSIPKTKPSKDWPEKGHITLENYGLKYREDAGFIINNLTTEIKPGEKIGIVGRTGAGKSSLTLGLFRMIEFIYGDIKIDGLDIKKIGLHDLRQKLTIIPQDPIVFSGTIKMNLDPFGSHSDHELWSALELSYLKEYVSELDGKLLFECSEGGQNLSVGQRQLLCLARALLRKTKILVLDEATASVDHNTDDLIQATIRKEFSDCTILTIAHRLNTIMDSTRIMVLDKGQIAEFDSPKNLLEKKDGIFHSMAQHAGIL